MTLRFYIPLVYAALLTTQAGAQAQSAGFDYIEFDFDRRERDINDAVDECIGEQYSTAAIANCADQEFYAWDTELNRVYGLLMDRLNPDAQAALKTAQRAWIRYRDAEYEAIDSIMTGKVGTMYILVDISKRVALTKHRVEELTSHLHTLAN